MNVKLCFLNTLICETQVNVRRKKRMKYNYFGSLVCISTSHKQWCYFICLALQTKQIHGRITKSTKGKALTTCLEAIVDIIATAGRKALWQQLKYMKTGRTFN